MKIAAVCCTWCRPEQLSHLIRCFELQDYPERELIILDDAGQYHSQEGDRWKLISCTQRYPTLGDKRNAAVSLTSPDTEAIAIFDDDDLYLPWALSAIKAGLEHADWTRPSLVMGLQQVNRLKACPSNGLFHASWGYRRDLFERVGGYPSINSGEDQALAERFVGQKTKCSDPIALGYKPYFVHGWDDNWHISAYGHDAYEDLGNLPRSFIGTIVPKDSPRLNIKELVEHAMPVRLIGKVTQPEGSGPWNGMYALQKALHDKAPEWFKIGGEPDEGEICWYWNWEDIRRVLSDISRDAPFIIGPNVLFMWSSDPGGSYGEREILEATSCRAIMCHSLWYEKLIRQHLNSTGHVPIFRWPYPIFPLPDGPSNADYDVLVYDKSGKEQSLLIETIRQNYPKTTVLRYGQYRREELYDLASRSRCCVYCCNDDHGPLAQAEIMLCGCPVIGMEKGAPFVVSEQTGVQVDNLDWTSVGEAIRRCHHIDREEVRETALRLFDADRIADAVIEALDYVRRFSPTDTIRWDISPPGGYPVECGLAT